MSSRTNELAKDQRTGDMNNLYRQNHVIDMGS